MLDLLFMFSGSALAISFLLHSATKSEIKKDNELQRVPTKKMLNMRKVTGQMMGVSGAVLLFAFAINLSSPAKDSATSEATAVEATETESDSQSEEQAKLGPYSVAAIPNGVPSAYTMQYKELADIISRADATLRLIKNTINKCEAPCPKPLSEIEQQLLLLSDVIDETRNELFRGSEIARVMAEEDPDELHTQRLYELQQELIATRYSLETMQIADSWESWEEPIDYVESTRTKRLYKISLADTVLIQQENKEESTSSEIPYPFASTQAEADFFTAIGLTLENGIITMRDASSLSRVCGKVCPDVPGSDWGLQLEPMNQEVFELDHNLYDFARSLRDIPEGSSPNIDFEARDILINDMERMSDYISLLMTHNDWSTWQEAWDTMDEANFLIEKMYELEVYTVPR